MKLYIFDYSSEGNLFSGEVCIEAKGLVEAQDKFIEWVKKQQTYQHMWQLSFRAREVKLAE
jgi:hypothetical protein